MWRKATIGGLAALAIVAGGAGVTIAQAAQTSYAQAIATAEPTGTPTPSPTATTGQAAKAFGNGGPEANGEASAPAGELEGGSKPSA